MQVALARGLAETTVGTNITVNSVLAGPTFSEGVGTFIEGIARQRGITTAQMEKDFFEGVRPSSLLKRFEKPEEVAAMVAFVASPLSSGTNGARFACRGGSGTVDSIVRAASFFHTPHPTTHEKNRKRSMERRSEIGQRDGIYGERHPCGRALLVPHAF